MLNTMATLREVRENLKITQGEISRRTGINIPTFSNYESGHTLPLLEDMVILEKQLGQKIDWGEPLQTPARREMIQNLITLIERYPLMSVLNFGQRALREGTKIGNPGVVISHYTRASGDTQEPLLPSDINDDLR